MPDTVTSVLSFIGAIGTISAVIFAFIAFSRNKGKDTEEDGRQYGMMLTDIGYIKSGVDDIKSEQREQRNINVEVLTRMTAVEASTKQAHRRIDRLENKSISESERRD